MISCDIINFSPLYSNKLVKTFLEVKISFGLFPTAKHLPTSIQLTIVKCSYGIAQVQLYFYTRGNTTQASYSK